MTSTQLIPFLLSCLIGVCVYYFKRWDTKIDKLEDFFHNHETRITVVEKDIKQLQTTVKN